MGASLSGSNCGYMVDFQYGSIVLFNVRDHEVDGYLKIVERHASGLLPEMRKDGQYFHHKFLYWIVMGICTFIYVNYNYFLHNICPVFICFLAFGFSLPYILFLVYMCVCVCPILLFSSSFISVEY